VMKSTASGVRISGTVFLIVEFFFQNRRQPRYPWGTAKYRETLIA
jgi:hypothetical protein